VYYKRNGCPDGSDILCAGIIQEIKRMSAIRMQFLLVAGLILVGIWLSGFNVVHWFLYVPVAALAFAGITGICPGYIILQKLGFKAPIVGNKL